MADVAYLKNLKTQLEGKKVCIFAMGLVGRALRDKLDTLGIHIDFFCDNNESLWNTSYHGTECISYPQLLEMNPDDVVVLIASGSFYSAIKEQLFRNGFRNCIRVFIEKIYAEEYIREHEDDLQERIDKVIGILEDEKSRKVYRHLTDFWKMMDTPDDYFREICSANQYFDQEIIRANHTGGGYL